MLGNVMSKQKLPKLNAKQSAFVDFYCVHFNATRAAKESGYSEKSAESLGLQLLRKPQVQAAIAAKQSKRANKLEITAERVLNEWARIAFAKGNDAVSFGPMGVSLKDSDDLTDDVLATIAEVSESTSDSGTGGSSRSLRLKYHSKTEALNALSKHLALFAPEKVELSAGELLQAALAGLSSAASRKASRG